MPNHCHNKIEIYGEEKDLKKIIKFLEGKDRCFDFNNVIPIPKELENTKAPVNEPESFENRRLRKVHGADNWYDWKVKNWSTKWNSYEDSLENNDGDWITYEFDTAWSPPENVIFALREKFPNVDISAFYDEPGVQMAGYY